MLSGTIPAQFYSEFKFFRSLLFWILVQLNDSQIKLYHSA